MAPPFSFDKAPLIGAAKYANVNNNDPGIGRFSTLLPKLLPPGYVKSILKTLPSADRKVQIGKEKRPGTYTQFSKCLIRNRFKKCSRTLVLVNFRFSNAQLDQVKFPVEKVI